MTIGPPCMSCGEPRDLAAPTGCLDSRSHHPRPSFPPPMSTAREPLPHDRMSPAHRPLPPVSPDCAAGKCRPCDGRAMDDDRDEIVGCQHECHKH